MKNWNIGTRISAGFTVVILIAAALGLFAWTKVGVIDKNSTQAVTEDVPKLYLVGQVQKNMQATYNLALRYAATSNIRERAELETQMQAVHMTNSAVLAQYEKLIRTDKGARCRSRSKRPASSSIWQWTK